MVNIGYFTLIEVRRNLGEKEKMQFLDGQRCHLRMAKIQPRGQKTARRAAKRPPAGKLKLSRLTSGYGGLMIPLGRIRLTPKNSLYGCSVKKRRFSGQKWALAAAPMPPVQQVQHKNLAIMVSGHDGDQKFG